MADELPPPPPPYIPQPPDRQDSYLVERTAAPEDWTRHEFPAAGEDDHRPGWAAWFLEPGHEVPAGWEDDQGAVLWRDPREQRLVYPITLGGGAKPLEVIRYAAIRGKFMRGMPMGQNLTVGDFLDLAAALSTQPARVFDRMHPEDVGEVIVRMRSFLDGGPGTGARSGAA